MQLHTSNPTGLPSQAHALYRRALGELGERDVPFLIGGAYALAHHTGLARDTKDIDVFVRPEDCERTLGALSDAGFRTELTFPHWLGKGFAGEYFIDVVFGSGNGVCRVDAAWFEHATDAEVLGLAVRLCPAEELIWSKAFIQERERYDGADIAHLLRRCGQGLDWQRLLRRFGPHWRVLLGHLVLFGYIYPGERSAVPDWVLQELCGRVQKEGNRAPPAERLCQGTLLSREQYLVDIEQWGYADARLLPKGTMTEEAVSQWTGAIGNGK